MSAVSKRTIRLAPEYFDGPYIDDLRCDGLIDPHRLMAADAQDIRTTHDIAWGDYPALPAAIHAPALVPRPAPGARLATVTLIDLNGAARLIVKLAVTTQVPSAGMVQVLDRGVPVSAL